ncbi:MAG: formate dehydrogenase accessory sulfurtransferase FdhD [Planctomycetota bacterium]|nr:formate dehydrogenase accessory sulfurtransferase FdhD [Planctomycetota bacterium]
MEPSVKRTILRLEPGRSASLADEVVVEARIELDVNEGRGQLPLVCSPCDVEALAVGLLLSDGAIRHRQDLHAAEYFPAENKVAVLGDFDESVLKDMQLHRVQACGAAAHTFTGSGLRLSPQQLLALAEQFDRRMDLWRRTGGVHACALAEADGIVLFAEDIGRHNAFDKVMGKAFLEGIDVADRLVLTTCRLSGTIVTKAVACGVCMLASGSAVTHLAVELAEKAGLTLVGFLRDGRMNVYADRRRIDGKAGPAASTPNGKEST